MDATERARKVSRAQMMEGNTCKTGRSDEEQDGIAENSNNKTDEENQDVRYVICD